MKIHISQRFMNLDGITPLIDSATTEIKILKEAIVEALLIPRNDLTPKEKYDNYELYGRLKDVWGEFDFTAEEITKLKKWIGEDKPPLIMGQAWDMLEQKIVDPNPKPPPPDDN